MTNAINAISNQDPFTGTLSQRTLNGHPDTLGSFARAVLQQ